MTAGSGAEAAGGIAPSLWAFGPDVAPVTVRNAEALLAHLPVFLGGWPLRRLGDGRGNRPDIDVVALTNGGFAIRTGGPGGGETGCAGEFEAASALADRLIACFVARAENRICLEAGAVAIDGGLVLLLGGTAADRSGVALQLTAAGYRLFGDDRLGVELSGDGGAHGLCLGLMPRVPLPLPTDCGQRFAEFVDGYTEIRDERTIYLKLWEGEAAGFGEMAPFAALVRLDGGAAGPARLEPDSPAALAGALRAGSFAPQIAPVRLAESLDAIAGKCACYRLGFASIREAAEAVAAGLRGARATSGAATTPLR